MLRAIILEDSYDDYLMLGAIMKDGGCFVQTEFAGTINRLSTALDNSPWDFIVCDYTLASATALEALEVFRQKKIDIPFIVVCGSVGEEVAVGAMRAGAHDVVMKSNLSRLVPAIEREMRQAAARRARLHAEEALFRSEEQIRQLLEVSNDAICGLDPEGRCTFLNRTCAQWHGLSDPGKAIGVDMHGLIHHSRADGSAYAREGCPIHGSGPPRERIQMGEDVFWRLDGTSFPVEYWSHPVWRGAVVVATILTYRDVTARRRLEEEMRQAQKMDAVGRLAGGVAHDFNNLLTIINGYSDMLLTRLREGDPLHQNAAQIRKAGEQATSLTRRLLAFSRRQPMLMKKLDLSSLVEEFRPLLRRLLGENIGLTTLLTPGLIVMGDNGHFEQLLMNLAVNARDAMPKGGELMIEAQAVEFEESHATPGPHALLTVTDSGCGMDKAVMEHLFEPFFTTKPVGQGTGLGLSTVHGVVKQCGGTIAVESEPGKGTTFRIYLPRVAGLATSAAAGSETSPKQGTETILLVEDQDQLLDFTAKVLGDGGYRVLQAANGGEAMLISETHPGPIQLLLTDVIMPRMNGRDLAERLLPQRPEMRALFMSGYPGTTPMNPDTFLPKPFSPEALLSKVRECLDA